MCKYKTMWVKNKNRECIEWVNPVQCVEHNQPMCFKIVGHIHGSNIHCTLHMNHGVPCKNEYTDGKRGL
jgi:hypothetical protein